MKRRTSVILGIILIAVGLIFALNALGITDIDVFFDGWWTLFIIVPCGIGLFTEREKTGNLIGILIGVLLLLNQQNIIELKKLWSLIIPAVIILIGIRLVFGSFFQKKSAQVQKQVTESGRAQHSSFAAFTATNVDFDGQAFFGAELNAIFGGIKYDLRNAIIEQDCVINATAIFGSIDILLPENVNVKISSTSLFGGVSNKRKGEKTDGAWTVYINGTGIFGGVDVK